MDIILIEPPPTNQYGNMRQFGSIGTYKADIAYPPIDLMKIAGCLREANIRSLLYDANTLKAGLKDIAALIKKEKPRLIVFTTSTTAINKDIKVAQKAKEISRDIVTATFGAHIKGAPVETLRDNDCLDIAIYGDPEMAVRDLVRKQYNAADVKGIYCRRNGEIIRNEPHNVVNNLDEYGIAAHDLINPRLYHDPLARRRPLTVTYGQIGCINNCSYCMSNLYSVDGLRLRTPAHFVEELKFIQQAGFKEVFFIDCGFTNNLKWANDVLDRMLADSLNLTWWCLARADHLDEGILEKMKAAGCHSVGIGVESANAEVIKNVGKKVDLKRVLELVRTAHKLKMRILLYFQFGLPGETRQTMEETLGFALASGADLVTFGVAVPVPGTEFYNYIKKNNWFITDDWSKFDPALPPVYSYPQLSSQEIYAFSKKAYKAFYMRPSFIFKRAISQRSLVDIRNNWSNFINFVKRMFLAG